MIDIAENNKEYIEHLDNSQLCSGILEIDGELIDKAVITFIQPQNNQGNTINYNTNHYTDGINGVKNWHWNNTFEMHNNNIIKDKVISNNGNYVCFIENGVYDIKIQYNGKTEVVKNQEVTDGLQDEFFYTIQGQIQEKLYSTYIMVDEIARNIRLKYINQYNNLINGKIVISQDDNLIVYKKINNKDLFALEPGVYNIRLMADNINTIIIKDFNFTEDMDFVESLFDYLTDNDIIIQKDEQPEPIPDTPTQPLNDETLDPT